jgi:uncharacterized RDD family membrane protein YckC
MTCHYCGTRNGDGERRCTRCGRKPEDTLSRDTLSSDRSVSMVHGALATKLQPAEWPTERLTAGSSAVAEVAPPARTSPGLSRAVQTSFFHASNVIPIEAYGPPRPEVRPRNKTDLSNQPVVPKPVVPRPNARRAKSVPEGQGTLDFLPSAPPKPRQLSTTVDAVIYCEAPVATTLHRAVASAIDWSMVLLGYAIFLAAFHYLGGGFVLSKTNLGIFAGAFLLIGFTYGLIFSLAGAETLGNHCTQLRLTTFDGFPPELLKHRLLRFGAACFVRCTLLGLLWSLADEESLSWIDHISHTFPTPRETDTLVFRKR